MVSVTDKRYVKAIFFISAILLVFGLLIYLKYKQIVSVKEDISESVEAEALQNIWDTTFKLYLKIDYYA